LNLNKLNKILIIRLSSLGDILLTTPIIRSLKNKYPHLTIDFVLRKEYEDTLSFNPHIQNIFSLTRKYEASLVKKKLINEHYDLVVDLQNNLRSRSLSKNISKNIVRFKKPNLSKFLLVNFKINRLKNAIPIPVRYANSIPKFTLDNKGPELFIDKSVKTSIDNTIPTIAFCPGSRHKTKMWPEEYFIELGKKFIANNFQLVLFGGKDDLEVCSRMKMAIPGVIDLSNDNILFETAINMKNCKTIICNDSGLMHSALAVNIPVVAIYGSTVKEFGFAPYKGKSLVLENNLLSCRPCSHVGRDDCPKKHFKCMLEITPEIAYQKTTEFIESL